jgi:hypothetical protein
VVGLAKDAQYLNLDIVLSMAVEVLPGYAGYAGETDDLECTHGCTNIVGNWGLTLTASMIFVVQCSKKKKSPLFQSPNASNAGQKLGFSLVRRKVGKVWGGNNANFSSPTSAGSPAVGRRMNQEIFAGLPAVNKELGQSSNHSKLQLYGSRVPNSLMLCGKLDCLVLMVHLRQTTAQVYIALIKGWNSR